MIEINDGYGLYVCKYGHVHDYSKVEFESAEQKLSDPKAKVYESVEEMFEALKADNAVEGRWGGCCA